MAGRAFVCAFVALAVVVSESGPLAQTSTPTIASVSGMLASGSTLTITGSGFGSKAAVPPLKWDTFEGGTSGAKLTGWALEASDPAVEPVYSTVVRRASSTMSARANFVNGNWNSSFGVSGTALPRLYLDAWYYYDAASPYSRNHKLFRIISNNYTPNLYYNVYCGTTSSHLSQDGVDVGNYHVWMSPTAADLGRTWVHLQAYFKESSPSAADGTAMLWIDGVLQASQVGNFRTRTSSATFWNTVFLGNYLGHEADANCPAYGDAYTYWDDVYLDITQARVEIGDASTYAASRHREIQIPSAWSATSISVKLHAGSFPDLTTLYLYVVTEAGVVNATGYQLSATGEIPPRPSPPRNVRIVKTGG